MTFSLWIQMFDRWEFRSRRGRLMSVIGCRRKESADPPEASCIFLPTNRRARVKSASSTKPFSEASRIPAGANARREIHGASVELRLGALR